MRRMFSSSLCKTGRPTCPKIGLWLWAQRACESKLHSESRTNTYLSVAKPITWVHPPEAARADNLEVVVGASCQLSRELKSRSKVAEF